MKDPLKQFMLALSVIVFALIPFIPVVVSAAPAVDVWWPTDGAHAASVQPFKALLEGVDLNSYQMYWQVDGGQLNAMENNTTDASHKEASVDLSNWTWHGSGPYQVTFLAKEGGTTVASKTISLYVANGLPAAPAPAPVTQSPTPAPVPTSAPAPAQVTQVQMWWPLAGSSITGVQPFKALVPGVSADTYSMYWQVDDGQMNLMTTSYTDAPHKEASVDLSGWHWGGSGPYLLTFTAKNAAGAIIAQTSFSISIPQTTAATPTPAPVSAPASTPAPTVSPAPSPTPAVSAPASASGFYLDSNSASALAERAYGAAHPEDAAAMQLLASTPTAIWLGGWNTNVESDVAQTMSAARSQGTKPVFIAYNIPNRDCGGYSAGGAQTDADYISWISQVAKGIGSGAATVILEPDGLANTNCLSSAQLAERIALIKSAATILKGNPETKVYLDAGHANWVDAATMGKELAQAGVGIADGFSLNVSNFDATNVEESYGAQVSAATGGSHFVIDTSRNGAGSDGQWCNPPGRAIGSTPTTNTGDPLADAFLWLKVPGESDGTCNGGPSAGTWWPSYALELTADTKL